MRNKKLSISIVVILILIIFIQIAYFNNKKQNNTEVKIAKEEKTEGIIFNIDDLYKYYSEINISKEELEKNIYNFITKDLYNIYTATKDKDVEDNRKYYDENYTEIGKMGINTKEDFILIAEDLKNAMKNDSVSVSEIKIEVEDEYLKNTDDYLFNLIIGYTNSGKTKIKCQIPIENIGVDKEESPKYRTIEYSANSDIARVFDGYKGPVKVDDYINIIHSFSENIGKIYEDTNSKSINDIIKLYGEKKSEYSMLGIDSVEDFEKIVYQINNDLSWKKDEVYQHYEIDCNNRIEDNKYLGYKVMFNYNYTEQISIVLYIAKNEFVSPIIRVSGTIDGGI